ncbi:MAG: proprotein convertase P-domain-containing protein, partial [Planctomycetota bacterium]
MERVRRSRRRFLVSESLERRQLLAGDLCSPADLVPGGLTLGGSTPGASAGVDSLSRVGEGEGVLSDLDSLAWLDDLAPAEPIRYPSGDESIEVIALDEYVAIDGGESFVDLGLDFMQPERLFGNSISVFRLPTEVPVGPSVVPVVSASFQQLDATFLPVFGAPRSDNLVVATDEIVVKISGETAVQRQKEQPDWTPEGYLQQHPDVAEFRRLSGTPDQYVVTLRDSLGADTLLAVETFDKDTTFEWATPNLFQSWQLYAAPNDPLFGNQWHLHNTGQGGGLVGHDANLVAAWDINAGGSSDIIVGIVDDGVSTDHEDLTVWTNPGEIADNGIDDDGNGWVDDIHGWNFVNNNNNSSYTADGDNHGTAVAGVAAADGNNGVGVAGAAYNSQVISARIFDGISVADDVGIAAAIHYMAGRKEDGTGVWNSAHVVNHSWGGGFPSPLIIDAFAYATASGGHDQGGINNFISTGNGAGPVSFPAYLSNTNDGVVAVGGTGNTGGIAVYSSFGPEVDIVAPTKNDFFSALAIETTDLMGEIGYDPSNYTGTGGNGFGGTSSAAPLATGVAALALAELDAQGLDLSPGELRDLIRANARLIAGLQHGTDGHNVFSGYGMIDAFSLLSGIGTREISVTSATAELVSGGDPVTFASTDLGSTAQTHVRIRNQGTEPLDVSGLSVTSGPFSIVAGDAGVLDLGESITVVLEFEPTTTGTATAVLEIASDDVDEAIFEVPLTGVGTFVSIDGTVFEDREADGTMGPQNLPVASQAVFLDENGNGMHDAGSTFSTTTPVDTIGGDFVLSPIEVSGVPEFDRIEVAIDITHPYVEDMFVELVAPDGSAITLAAGLGGFGDNYTGTIFADDAAVSINDGVAPFTGRFRPQQAFSNLDGVDANGTWNLRVTDTFAAFDDGTLNSWSITIGVAEPLTSTDANGRYAFRNVPDGDHTVAFVETDVYSVVASPAAVGITLSSADPYTNVDFPVAQNDVAYVFAFEDENGDGIVDPGEGLLPEPQWFVDTNGNGQFDVGGGEYQQDDDVGITDNTTVTSTLEISSQDPAVTSISNLDVLINASHTYTGDVSMVLVAPDGTRVELIDQRGGGGDNFTQTRFDDDAASSIADAFAPFTGSFTPEEPLSGFNGIDGNGTWTLEVTDSAGGDTGTLQDWTLLFSPGDDMFPIDDDGWFTYPLPDQESMIGLVPDPFYEYTIPANGQYTLTPDGQPHIGLLLGARVRQASISGTVFHDPDGDQTYDPGEPAVEGWSVFLDENENGVADVQSQFGSSNALPINNFFQAESTIDVSGASVLAGDLEIGVNIDYNGVESLSVELIAPSGTTVVLVDTGISGSDMVGTVFDDDADTAIGDGASPYTGSFRP